MVETELNPFHPLPSGLCEDPSGEAASLISRMAKADPAALTELFANWSPIFLGIACRILGNQRDADAVVQDTFCCLWRRAAEYNPHHSPPFVWAFAVLRNYCAERLQSRPILKKISTPAAPVHLLVPPEKHENLRVMPLDDYHRVKAALEHLPPDERNSLEAAVFLAFNHTESPDHPDSPPGSVKNRLRQSLKKVRNHLSRYEL